MLHRPCYITSASATSFFCLLYGKSIRHNKNLLNRSYVNSLISYSKFTYETVCDILYKAPKSIRAEVKMSALACDVKSHANDKDSGYEPEGGEASA